MLDDVFVPLLTYPDPHTEASIKAAASFAAGFAKTATFCAIETDIPPIAPGFGGAMIDVSSLVIEAEAQSRKTAAALLSLASSASAPGTLKVTTRTVRAMQGDAGNLAGRLARTYGLSLVGVPAGDATRRALAEGVIFNSGLPVLIFPEAGRTDWDLGQVAIAWDGSRAAARAVHDALPLIAKAASVTIITAQADKDVGASAVEELKAYFARLGIASHHHDTSSTGRPIGTALQQAALTQGASLLVMGAFGHSRLRDFVLGGATRSILEDLRMPILLSH